jgi:hypothetical protein
VLEADADRMTEWRWWAAGAGVLAGAVLLHHLIYPIVGSGLACEGIGFGCTPERQTDTLLIEAVYVVLAAGTFVIVWRRSRRGRPWRAALVAGVAITVLATAAATWSQLPRYQSAPGTLGAARQQWERVLADGRAVASRGTPLGDSLRSLDPGAARTCRDAYGRSTGTREFRWSNRGHTNAYGGSSDSTGAATAAALGRWAERLRRPGLTVTVSDPDGNPASDRRLQANDSGAALGGRLSVRAAFYASELEIEATTGCHRS